MRLPDNPRARACGEYLRNLHTSSPADSDQRAVLARVIGFPFEAYPDTTAPWHLLQHDPAHMRWEHVHDVIRIIDQLRQPTGSGMGDTITLQPFQVMIILAFLGPENPETKLRVVREGALTLARKQGKTALVAALVTALMCLSPESHGLLGQDIQVGASDREQAGITFQMVDRMVSLDKEIGISEKFRSVPSSKRMQHKKTLTQLRCLSSDAYRHHGGNPAIVLLDEIGNVSSAQAEEFYSVLTTGFAAQKEPLTFLFSTQAPVDQHFFSLMIDRAKAINEGRLAPSTFAGFAFEIPEVDADGEKVDPYDESIWYLANPGLNTIANIADIRDWATKAKEMPSLENKYRLLKLNQRVSATSAFVSRTVWEENAGKSRPMPEDLYGRSCWLGIDLSETTDLTALVALFEPAPGEERHPVIPWFWIPGDDLITRSKRDHVPFDVWSREGLIDTQSARTIDYGRIAERIIECLNNYEVLGIGFDRYRMKYLRSELRDRGYEWPDDSSFLQPIGQGFADQSRSLQVLEDLLLNRKLWHGNHPILKWNAANTVVVQDQAKNRKADKARSFGRIDGMIALALAAHTRADSGLLGTDPGFSVEAIIG